MEATNGLQALRACEQCQQLGRLPDLVVSDQRMPGMEGVALLREIERRWPSIRRILLSGYTTGEMVVELGYAVLDKQLPAWQIKDEIDRYARGS